MMKRPHPLAWLYVIVAGGLAAWGFVVGRPEPILVAGALTLPASLVTVPGYYLAYGFLSMIHGGSPSVSGSGTVAVGGPGIAGGHQTDWFAAGTETLGVLALVVAAAANVLLIRLIRRGPAHPRDTALDAALVADPGRPIP